MKICLKLTKQGCTLKATRNKSRLATKRLWHIIKVNRETKKNNKNNISKAMQSASKSQQARRTTDSNKRTSISGKNGKSQIK